jgi:L-2-amino-thiazoline-4-carboxylic acid hydrolase
LAPQTADHFHKAVGLLKTKKGADIMESGNAVTHKFLEDSHMTFEEVFDFAYKGLIPVLQGLAHELGEERFLEVLKQVVFDVALKGGQDTARQLPCNDFDAFNASLREPSRFAKHILTVEIVEDTPQAVEVKVTECLWAKSFREMGAAELGYRLICQRDYADCQGFNSNITLTRSKTLMQGDDYCNHRFVWEG